MDEENKITLLDDEGNEVELYIEEQFIFEGKEYIVQDGDVITFRFNV